MIIRRKQRSMRWCLSLSWRSLVSIGILLTAINVGMLLAQDYYSRALVSVNEPLGATRYLINYNAFVFLRTSMLAPAFAIAIAAFIVVALGHFFAFGAKDMSIQGAEDEIPWWTLTERVNHAIMVVVFVILLLTGLQITFGRTLQGGAIAYYSRFLHEYAGFVFAPSLLLMLLMWASEALPKQYDWNWFLHLGGYLGYKGQLTSGKFNAGQKLWYWIAIIAGIVLAVTGFALYFQLGKIQDFRLYVVLHLWAAVPIILMFIVHLYLATIGVKGSFMTMIHGKFSKQAATHYHADASPLKKLQGAQAKPGGGK